MQAERTQAELGEAMMALSILMAECKGNAARRANLEKQVCPLGPLPDLQSSTCDKSRCACCLYHHCASTAGLAALTAWLAGVCQLPAATLMQKQMHGQRQSRLL